VGLLLPLLLPLLLLLLLSLLCPLLLLPLLCPLLLLPVVAVGQGLTPAGSGGSSCSACTNTQLPPRPGSAGPSYDSRCRGAPYCD
jgi:hypothetical protein